MRPRGSVFLSILIAAGLSVARSQTADGAEAVVSHLVCDSLDSPGATETAVPFLAWQVSAQGRAWRQSAWQILAASEPSRLREGEADLWDSGRVVSDPSSAIPYAGKPLGSRQRVFWCARVWDSDRQPSPWSAPSVWTTGILTKSEWQARWIGAPSSQPAAGAPLFRTEIRIRKPVRRATARLASLGWGQLFINGNKVGDDVLGAPFSDLNQRILYVTHDVTTALRPGINGLGLTVGNGQHSPVVSFGGRPDHIVVPGGEGAGYHKRYGRFGPPALLVELEVIYQDGATEFFGTDERWVSSPGPVIFNDLWRGETQDRRLDPVGWNLPDFDSAAWKSAIEIQPPPGRLEPCMVPPVRRGECMQPDRIEDNAAFFGTAGAGWPRLVVDGKPGRKIRMTGSVAGGFSFPTLEFILRGGREVLEPSFQFNASPGRLVVEGLSGPLEKEAVSYQLASTDLKPAGSFECSDAWFNGVHRALVRSHRSYVFGHPMDPTREKQAWTQDVQNMMDSAVYLTDVNTLYRNWWRDMRANQTEDGYLGAIVPVAGIQTHDWNCPWWSGMIIWLPWRHYLYYGDIGILRDAYPAMKSYLGFLGHRAAEGIGANGGALRGIPNPGKDEAAVRDGLLAWGTGDWQGLAKSPVTLTSTAAWCCYAGITAKTARLLGFEVEAVEFEKLESSIRDRFNRKFLDLKTGTYASPASQTAQAIPLALGLVPESHRGMTAARLADAVHAAKDHLNTGFVGTSFLLQTLTETGQADLAATIVRQRDFPGWATLMNEGVFKENWKGEHALMPSLGGPVGAWFYQAILGIRPDPTGPGFKRIIIKPELVGGLTWARGGYDSVRGKISVAWEKREGGFELRVEIPANTTATVFIPARSQDQIREGGRSLSETSGVRLLRIEEDRAVLAVASGSYQFQTSQ